jgi:Na+/proline symporter
LTLLMSAVGLGLWLFYQHQSPDPGRPPFSPSNRAAPSRISSCTNSRWSERPADRRDFAAGISTLDSALAALSETTVNGIYRKWIRPEATERQCLLMSRIAVAGWGFVLCLLAFLAGHLVRNEGLLNLAYKMPVLTYGPLLMVALFALARRGSFPAMAAGAAASVATALFLLVAKARGITTLDEFYIYPITCIVFAIVAAGLGALRKSSSTHL